MSRERRAILFVARVEHFGGSAVSLATHLRHLDRDLGRVLACDPAAPVARTMAAEGLVDEVVPIRWRGRRAAAGAALRIAAWALRNRGRLMAIHANGSADLLLALPAALVTGRPVVAWIHDQRLKTAFVRLAPVVRALGGRIRWAANSRSTVGALTALELAEAGDVVVAYEPIDPERVLCRRIPSDGPVRVSFLGDDTRRKGFHLLEAVRAGLAGGDARLQVFARRHAGRPAEIEAVWASLAAAPPREVELADRQEDVRQAYAVTDVLLVPSLLESFGRVVSEAMINGIPVVASDLPPVREQVGDEEAGLLFPPDDATAAVAALRRVVADPGLRERLGRRGRERARAFAAAETTRRLEALYRRP